MLVGSLTGALLVAAPVLEDPSFDRTVVLVLDHDDDGALGVVLNRPSTTPVEQVLPDWADLVSGDAVVFVGGPVGPDSALGLASLTPGIEEVEDPLGFRRVAGTLGLVDLDTPPPLLAPDLRGLRIYAGYAGWSPGQLEAEIAMDAWFVVEREPADAFSLEAHDLWRSVLRRQGNELALLSTRPADPTLN